jgi:hypothetical protein
VRRDLGHSSADTPAARTKQRTGATVLMVGICFNLVATLLPLNQRIAATVLFGIGGTSLVVSIVYYILARRRP